MAKHVHIRPLPEGDQAQAQHVVQKLETHLARPSVRTEQGHRFEFGDEEPVPESGDLSEALDSVAPGWRNHVEMGL